MTQGGQLLALDACADFVAGWVSGCAGVLVSHPLDTTKVRLQTQGVLSGAVNQYNGTWHCLVETVKKEKFSGLYKGISSPLLGTALWNAVVFGSYGNSLRYFAGSDDPTKMHNMRWVLGASLVAGVAQTFVICPLELVKTRLQIQSCSTTTKYKGLTDCVVKTVQKDGFRGLFKGYGATMNRDLVGFPTYFCSFELLCRCISSQQHTYDDLGPLALACAGGVTGAFSWACAFPADVIKCRIQVDYEGKYSGFLDCLRKSFREEGWTLFRRGFAPTVLRGIPMNATIFSIYTLSMRAYYQRDMGPALLNYF